jgi:hypothetical protein
MTDTRRVDELDLPIRNPGNSSFVRLGLGRIRIA